MGISFRDIGSFANGVNNASNKADAAVFADRKAELQADRQMHIDMKTKRYESELKSFEAEDKKFKAISAVNAKFKGSENEIAPSEYGAAYLQETNPTLLYQIQKDYMDYPELLNKQLAVYANPNFKTSTTRDTLDNKRKEDIAVITSKYKNDLEAARGDSKLINAILGKRDKAIAETIQNNIDGEKGTIAAKEIAIEIDDNKELGFIIGDEKPLAFRVPAKWIKDSKIADLRKDVKKDINNTNKNMINTTLDVFASNNVSLPKQFLTFEQGKAGGTITGIKDNGKIVVEQVKLLTNQATNFMSNAWVYKQDTDASNVSNYYSSVEANKLLTSRVRDYSSEETISQEKKGFWKDRENFIGFVPFSVVGLNNDFTFKNNKDVTQLAIINSKNRKYTGKVYFEALKEIAKENDPTFKNTNEATAINNLQDKLLKLNEGQSSDLLTKVKSIMKSKLISEEKAVDDKPNNLDNSGSSKRVIYNGESIAVNEESTKLFADNGVDINSLEVDTVTNTKTDTSNQNTEEKLLQEVEQDIKPTKKIETKKVGTDTIVKKITPIDIGIENQPVFESLQSIQKILPNEMTGKEIKAKYEINFYLPDRAIFRPSKEISEQGR